MQEPLELPPSREYPDPDPSSNPGCNRMVRAEQAMDDTVGILKLYRRFLGTPAKDHSARLTSKRSSKDFPAILFDSGIILEQLVFI